MWKYRSPQEAFCGCGGSNPRSFRCLQTSSTSAIKDKPTPLRDRVTFFQIENRRFWRLRTQGREPCSFSAVWQLHTEHIPIELHRHLHVRDSKRQRRNFLHHDCHDTGSLPRPRLNPPSARHSFEAGGGLWHTLLPSPASG